MKRTALALLLLAVAACPRDKKERAESIPVDTAKVDSVNMDLSKVPSAIPPASPDTFTRRKLTAPAAAAGASGYADNSLPTAPPELLDAVQREEGFSRFCFTEFGKKTDPSLRGNVVMAVTVGGGGVSDARVAGSNWSGTAGGAVNRCLNERAERAWKVNPGVVKPGRYAVRLSFTG
jgi:post-segregation antitoxin (ccd killing protein)